MKNYSNESQDNETIYLDKGSYHSLNSKVNQSDTIVTEDKKGISFSKKTVNLAKVFLWFGLGLLISGAIAFSLPNILLLANNNNAAALGNTYIVLLAVSGIGILVLSLVMSFASLFKRNSVAMIVSYVLYTVFMGILLSGVMLLYLAIAEVINVNFMNTFAYAFLITAGVFVLMGLLSMVMKKTSALFLIGTTLILGVGILCLVNFFLQLETIYWIVDIALFMYILIITAIDIHNANMIAQRADFSTDNNLAIYCAMNLYTDFVIILIRVMYYLLIIFASKKD